MIRDRSAPWAVPLAILALAGFAADANPGDSTSRSRERLVRIPMIFDADGHDVRTTACLPAREVSHPDSRWWQPSSEAGSASERAFRSTIVAIQAKDRTALLRWTDAKNGRDPQRFSEQADAYFRQLDVAEILSVPLSYELDGLAIFVARMRAKDRPFSAPFVFSLQADGSFAFLPYRTQKISDRWVEDWLRSEWGPFESQTPGYCSDDEPVGTPHRVPLASDTVEATVPRPDVEIEGASLANAGSLGDLGIRVRATLAGLDAAARSGDFNSVGRFMTAPGAASLARWLSTATAREQEVYRSALQERRPVFLWDASTLVVVYTSRRGKPVEVMYFTQDGDGKLLWTNSSRITAADRVFKKGPVLEVVRKAIAPLEKPTPSATTGGAR